MFAWPDLYFGPINLWTAPWLGRAYEEFNRTSAVIGKELPKVPNVQVEKIKTLVQHR